MRTLLITIAVVLAAVAGWNSHLSPDATGMILGLLIAIMAFVPVVAILAQRPANCYIFVDGARPKVSLVQVDNHNHLLSDGKKR